MGLKRTRNCCCPLNIRVTGPWLQIVFRLADFKHWEWTLLLWSNRFSSLGSILFLNKQYISIIENKAKDNNKYRFIKNMGFVDSGSSPSSAIYMWPWKSFLLFSLPSCPLKYLYIMPKIHALNMIQTVQNSIHWNKISLPSHFSQQIFIACLLWARHYSRSWEYNGE